MFRSKSTARSHHIDLDTIRETLAYMRDDVAADPALANVAGALDEAIVALDAATDSRSGSPAATSPYEARFFSIRS